MNTIAPAMQCKKCNELMDLLNIDAVHTIFGKEITVSNTPTYSCKNCNEKYYLDDVLVEDRIRDAYITKLDTVDFIMANR